MRALAGTALVVVLLLASGCGAGDEEPQADPTGSSAEPAWNPCDGLDLPGIEQLLGTELSMDRGTAAAPRCALVPAVEGGAVVDANYLVFPEGLDAAWKQMGAPEDGSVTEPEIAGADAARMVANAGSQALGVTGFVQNGALVQVVNAVDTAPYDRRAVLAAVRETMRQLSAYARQDGAPQ